MATVIHIAGYKGGTGKTALSVHLANYIHFHLQKKVVLIGLCPARELHFLNLYYNFSFDFKDIGKNALHPILEEYKDYDYIVVDFPSRIEFMDIHLSANIIVLPTNSFTTDMIKTKLFLHFLNEKVPPDKVCIVPVLRIHNQTAEENEKVHEITKIAPVVIAPIIPYSKTFANLSEKNFRDYLFHQIKKPLDFIVNLKG